MHVVCEQFSRWRRFCHTYASELMLFIPMALMLFCIISIYTILRNLKDTLVVCCTGGGELLGFLKLYFVLPAVVLSSIILVHLLNIFDKKKLFIVIILFFLIYFLLFAFILFPLSDVLHIPEINIARLQMAYPRLYWLFPLIGNWSFSLFYIITELWASVVVCVLFWKVANDITKLQQAKRFYVMFSLIGEIGALVSGLLIVFCSNFSKTQANAGITKEAFSTTLFIQVSIVLLLGCLLLGTFLWLNKKVLSNADFSAPKTSCIEPRTKLGILKSFKLIITSPYLLRIAILFLAYGAAINLVENVWKGELREFCPDANDYNAWMGRFSTTTGAISILTAVVVQKLIRRFSWRVVASITPITLMITALVFYTFLMYKNYAGNNILLLGVSLSFLTVLAGFMQVSISKGVKYAVFDPTVQMAYIPLEPELRSKGQSIIGSLGTDGGKAIGAFIQSNLLIIAGGNVKLSDFANILCALVTVIVIGWLFAISELSKRFEAMTAHGKEQ
ncbi:MAG: NTP/NDP exchange transporter [Alphaproteobacteria bacterium]|nr:NTP/NDP exchange transporter [Alphaproteobacteria bacterium]